MEEQLQNIFQHYKIRKTNCREELLLLLLKAKFALSQPVIESELSQFDRVTIYRNLHTFLDKEIIHVIPDESGNKAYALTKTKELKHAEGYLNHVHFKCNQCEHLVCINEEPVPNVHLPKGYITISANYFLTGVCPSCNQIQSQK